MEHLGLSGDRLHFLDLPDAATPAEGLRFDAAVDAIVGIADACGARTLSSPGAATRIATTRRGSPWRAPRAERVGTRLWAYPIWGLHLPRDGEVARSLRAGCGSTWPGIWRRSGARSTATPRR